MRKYTAYLLKVAVLRRGKYVQQQGKRQQTQTKTQDIPSEHQETLFHHEGDGALAQVAQGGSRISILGHIQKPRGQAPGQPVLDDPA